MGKALELFEVKIRKPGDRIMANGKKVEGGKIVSRHFFRRSAEKAVVAAKALQIGNVVGVKRVRRGDIIGDLTRNKSIRELITRPKTLRELEQEKRIAKDVIVQNATLDSIVYGNISEGGVASKEQRAKRLEYNRKHEHKMVEE
jgi:hypothetical protein